MFMYSARNIFAYLSFHSCWWTDPDSNFSLILIWSRDVLCQVLTIHRFLSKSSNCKLRAQVLNSSSADSVRSSSSKRHTWCFYSDNHSCTKSSIFIYIQSRVIKVVCDSVLSSVVNVLFKYLDSHFKQQLSE